MAKEPKSKHIPFGQIKKAELELIIEACQNAAADESAKYCTGGLSSMNIFDVYEAISQAIEQEYTKARIK